MNTQQNPNHNMGRGMIWLSMIAALAMLTWFFSGAIDRRNNPNRNPGGVILEDGVEVTLQRNRAGHYLATGSINGQVVDFLVDTGASDVVLAREVARDMNLENLGPVTLSTANGTTQGYFTRLDELRIGPIRIQDVGAVVVPDMDLEVLLGMSVLRDLDWQQRGNQLILHQPNGG